MKQLLPILIFLGALAAGMPSPASAAAPTVLGDAPGRMNVGVGYFNIGNGGDSPAAARIEWRFGKKKFRLGPLLGLLADIDEGLMAYGGVYLDIAWRQLVLTPMTSIGAWHMGESKDLGGTLQFRSALELAWQAAVGVRLGVQIGHISDANLHLSNPGENDLLLTFAIPF